MSWNYRVIRHIAAGASGDWFAIHEVYYDADGAPCAVSEKPISPHGETRDDLLTDLRMMQEAADKPTLDYVLFSKPE